MVQSRYARGRGGAVEVRLWFELRVGGEGIGTTVNIGSLQQQRTMLFVCLSAVPINLSNIHVLLYLLLLCITNVITNY